MKGMWQRDESQTTNAPVRVVRVIRTPWWKRVLYFLRILKPPINKIVVNPLFTGPNDYWKDNA